MTVEVVVFTIGVVGGLAGLSWLLRRFVSRRRYRKALNDRLEALDLDMRIRNASS